MFLEVDKELPKLPNITFLGAHGPREGGREGGRGRWVNGWMNGWVGGRAGGREGKEGKVRA